MAEERNDMDDMRPDMAASLLHLAAELTMAWLGNPNTRAGADEVPSFLRRMHESMAELAGAERGAPAPEPAEEAPAQFTPAVSARKSLSNADHIVSMIDGKPYRTLKRHLSTNGLTPDQYRERYGLKPDCPMVAPGYSEQRRETAKRLGLGRKARTDAPSSEQASTAVDDQSQAEPQPRRKLRLPEPS